MTQDERNWLDGVAPPIRRFTIWSEGQAIEGGGVAQARLLRTVEATTFGEACDIAFPSGRVDEDGRPIYDKVSGTLWGCRLFNNEADARRAFG